MSTDKLLTATEFAQGSSEETALASMPFSELLPVVRTMMRSYEMRSPPLLAFQDRLQTTFGKHRADRIWAQAALLAAIRPEFRNCDLWMHWIQQFSEREEAHAAMPIHSISHLSDIELIDFLYKNKAHCPECEEKAIKTVDFERLARLQAIVQEYREEDRERIEYYNR